MKSKILKFPDPMLFKQCSYVTVFNDKLKSVLDEMYEAMKDNSGLGLAANQIGYDLFMFVMDGPHGRLNMINPIIVDKSKMPANLREGCLSVPGVFVMVPARASWVHITYQDETGKERLVLLKDMYAVCAQHEVEHLKGQSFLSNKSLTKTVRNKYAKKWGL